MRNTGLFVRIALIAAVCICIGTIVKLEINYNHLKSSAVELEAKIEDCRTDIEQLKTDLDGEIDDEYVIKIAREKLNYCMPDEIVFYGSSNK